MRLSVIFAFALFTILLFSSDSSAEEEFTISVVSGDTTLTIGDTSKSWVLSGAPYSQLEVSDDFHQARISDLSKNSTFVFKLQGTNFDNDTTYTFGYRFTTYHPLSSDIYNPNGRQNGYRGVEVVFSGNNSEEINYNLAGNLSQYTYSNDDNCTVFKVRVYLEGKSSEDLFYTYSDSFFLEGYNDAEECIYYESPNTEKYIIYGVSLFIISILVFSHYSAKRMNTNIGIVLLLIILGSFMLPLTLFVILICWGFGVNFGGGERDQEEYERSGKAVPALITIGSFVSIFIGLALILSSWVSSDIRLKRNIVLIGQSQSNLNIYEYNYVWSNKKYRGVMAQDLLKSNPEAVSKLFGYYLVNYSKIDVDFEEISNP
tara:strand:+ start:219 stop:1337 length:1119 start_codon:yes stop_codon:yes gene_type:complete